MTNVHVLYGDDEFSAAQALQELKRSLGPEDMRDANTTVLPGQGLSLEALEGLVVTVPFLAEARLVVVEGLLEVFEDPGGGRRRRRDRSKDLGTWAGLPRVLEAMPPTTILVFREGRLSERNPLLNLLRPVAQVRGFPLLRGENLRAWIVERARRKGSTLTPQAVWTLADLVGGNLRILDSELEKLSLYAGERPITPEDVRLLVAPAREASIFAAVDALLEGRPQVALRQVKQLLAEGTEVTHVLTMMTRQARLVLLAKEFGGEHLDADALARRLKVSQPFAARKASEQAQRHSRARLEALYGRLLEADTAIKTGQARGESVLETLVVEVAGDGRA